MPDRKEIIEVSGRTVAVSNPDKVYFPRTGHTKLDLVRYYLSVADGALRGVTGRPMVLKRFVNGAEGEAFFQKRAPSSRPDWIETVVLKFPSGRSAEEIVVDDAAGLAWVANLGCIDLNPHPVRADDLDHPDELRVDLDPVPGVDWAQIVRVALVAREALADFGLTGWPKTSGSRGMHIYCRIAAAAGRSTRCAAPRWRWPGRSSGARRRTPPRAGGRRSGTASSWTTTRTPRTAPWPRPTRSGPTPDARVSAPLTWDEVPDCDPAEFTIDTMPERFARLGDVAAGIDEAAGSLDALLELAARDEAAGLPDAPWPPHYEKQEGEAPGSSHRSAAPRPRRRRARGPGAAAPADGASVGRRPRPARPAARAGGGARRCR